MCPEPQTRPRSRYEYHQSARPRASTGLLGRAARPPGCPSPGSPPSSPPPAARRAARGTTGPGLRDEPPRGTPPSVTPAPPGSRPTLDHKWRTRPSPDEPEGPGADHRSPTTRATLSSPRRETEDSTERAFPSPSPSLEPSPPAERPPHRPRKPADGPSFSIGKTRDSAPHRIMRRDAAAPRGGKSPHLSRQDRASRLTTARPARA